MLDFLVVVMLVPIMMVLLANLLILIWLIFVIVINIGMEKVVRDCQGQELKHAQLDIISNLTSVA